eukprot:UN02065
MLDTCAAPGNKTAQLAALCPSGKVFAFERNEKRCGVLKKRLELMGADHVQIFHQDFLETDPSDPQFTNITTALVDPSCSGSGMLQQKGAQISDAKRLDSLAQFQV